MDEYISQIRARVLQRMDLSRDMLDEEIEEFISEETAQMLQGMIISLRERVRIEQQVFNSLRKLDALQDLVDDPEVSEIMVNGPQNIFYEKFGCVHKWEQSFASEEKMQDIIQQIDFRSDASCLGVGQIRVHIDKDFAGLVQLLDHLVLIVS